MVQWFVDHQVLVAATGVAILDLVFALSPASANGFLHGVYLFLKGNKDGAAK